MLTLKTWWLLSGKSAAYSFFAIIFTAIAIYSITIVRTTPFIVFGLCMGAFSLYLFRLGSNIAEPLPKQLMFQRESFMNSGGVYNDLSNNYSINGDYVQGDKNIFHNFDFNQDLSSAITEIRRTLSSLEKQVGSAENAQQKVIDDLVEIFRQSSKSKNEVYNWLKILEFTSVMNEVDAAEKVVEVATRMHSKPYKQPDTELDRRYRRLEYLLKTAQWREADDETVRVIREVMPSGFTKHGCTDIDVDEIPSKDLRAINKLWLQSSGGRFGFSVQKQIWLKISRIYQNPNKFNLRGTEYDAFVEQVGWSREQSRIYHVSLTYLITNPKGHLPVKVLLLETYNSASNYCYLSNCLFDDFMKRDYSEVPFLPAWLRRFLLLD